MPDRPRALVYRPGSLGEHLLWQLQMSDFSGTERAFTGKYEKNKAAGEYVCAGCGQPLFESDAKYDSGSGWPSFTRPAGAEAVEEHRDMAHGMVRTEVVCSKCAGHLGHVFDDGPRDEGGLRYCINSAALSFKPEDK